jgi:NADPH:quinone reductase-like Zn-dependent oxidoreductase
MRAYVADPGVPDGIALHDVPSPTPGGGVAVVSVRAFSLNRGEVQHVRSYRLLPAGARLGWDVAGVVTAQATDGTGPDVGTEVFGWCQERGSWAEEVAVPVDHLVPTPAGLSTLDASTLGVAALTAYQATRQCRRPLGSATVLVNGSTGGVGLFAIQLASLGGAKVIASVQRAEDEALIRDAVGPNVTFDIEIGIDPERDPVDLVIETVGGQLLSNALVRVAPGGAVATIGRTDPADAVVPSGWFLKGARLEGVTVGTGLQGSGGVGAALAELGGLMVAGQLRSGVARVMPASDLPEAMRALIEREVRGKVVITWT